MTDSPLKKEIAQARTEYFRATNKALEKINLKFGDGREGLLNFLNIKDVENFSAENLDKN